MSRILSALLAVFLLSGFACTTALALPPDDYLGDSGIYVGVPNQRPAPNVLIIIDTSLATLTAAAGDPYNSGTAYAGAYIGNHIYYSNQQGGFSPTKALGGNTPVLLSGITCTATYQEENPPGSGIMADMTVNVHDILQSYGTYSGGGSTRAPNLSGGQGAAVAGSCVTAAQGEVYATGNYLNYIGSAATPVVSNVMIIKHTYQLWQKVSGVWQWVNYTRRFQLTANIAGAAVAAQEPGKGANWQSYWTELKETPVAQRDPRNPTHEIIGGVLVPVPDPLPAGYVFKDGWAVGITNYQISSADPSIHTQRQSFYDALVPVINGASPSVNFGFLKYNPGNQGAVLGAPLMAYGSDPSALIGALPWMNPAVCRIQGGKWTCDDTINSGPNRPQSEALYDAGHYLKATYVKTDGSAPNKQSVNLDTQTGNPNPCGYNHIIFLTNGLPNQDSNTPNLGDWDGDGYEATSEDYGLGTHWVDDVAYFLKHEAEVNGVANGPDNPGITTHVVLAFQNEDALMRHTATNGGGAFYNVFNTQELTNALQEIITNIVSESNTAFVAPVVPASSTNRTVSSNRVYLGLFKPQSNAPWHGNLKKYRVSSGNELLDVHGHRATDTSGDFIYSQSYWGTMTTADGEKIVSAEDPRLRNVVSPSYDPDSGTPDPDGGDGGIVDAGGVGGTLWARDFATNPRKIYTYLTSANSTVVSADEDLTAAQNAFTTGNAHITPATLAVADAAQQSRLIDFIHGYDSMGAVYPTTVKRKWILGDILHSKPLVFNYTKYADDAVTEAACYDPSSTALPIPTHTSGSPAPYATYNTTFIFLGANDGMVHAFRDCDGEELWAFIPPLLLEDLKYLPQPGHEYFADGASSAYVHDYDGDGNIEPADGDKVLLIFGLRRGGGNAYLSPLDARGAFYILDVTDPLNPQFVSEIKGGGTSLNPYYEMGESWSQPRLSKIKDGTTDKVVAFVGAGYDNNEDRRWGNTQSFPVTLFSADGNFTNDTDTTVATNDGDPGVSNAGVTQPDPSGTPATAIGAQVNPKGRGLYAIEIASLAKDVNNKYVPNFSNIGAKVWGYTYGASNTSTTNTAMTFSIPTDLTVIDWDGDGYADRIYAGDTGGQMWRFDLPLTLVGDTRQGVKTNWSADVIFRSNPGEDSTNGHKIFYRPAVARNGNHAMLYFGTGDREHPLNLASHDRMYMLFDRGQGLSNLADGMGVKDEGDLIDVTSDLLQVSADNAAIDTLLTSLYSDSNYGWYIRLENPGEKMLAPPIVFFGQAFYTTYAPLTSGQANCEVGNLGTSRLYHLDFRTGEAVFNYNTVNDSTDTTNERAVGEDGAKLLKEDRVRTLGEGIPSGIVTLMDASGKVTMMISASNRVGTYSAPDVKLITPVYWMQWNN